MTFKKFNYLFVTFTILLISVVVLFNYINNDYGLFRNNEKLDKKPFAFDSSGERTVKYLLAHRYIPENFNGVLIGPSHSANINTALIESSKLYNASLRGGNITELSILVEKMLENKAQNLEYVVISLSPYLTSDSGKKTSSMDPLEYWGSLGSISQLKFLLAKTAVKIGKKYDNFNNYGFNDLNHGEKKQGPKKLKQMIAEAKKHNVYIDPEAMNDLKIILEKLKQTDIKIFAYFYPRNYAIYQANYDGYKQYEKEMLELFDEEDVVWNFNDEKYMDLTNDEHLYYDGSHLTTESALFIVNEIEKKILENM